MVGQLYTFMYAYLKSKHLKVKTNETVPSRSHALLKHFSEAPTKQTQ